MKCLIKELGMSLFCFIVIACSSDKPVAPNSTVHATVQAGASSRGFHIVQSGETLYSIAFVYGLDYRRLAAINGIASDYQISRGQKLVLRGAGDINTDKKRQINDENVKVSTKQSNSLSTKTTGKSTNTVSGPISASSAVSKSPANGSNLQSVTTPSSTPSKSAISGSPSSELVADAVPSAAMQWLWPAPGRVIANFSSELTGNKGLNIAGKSGEPVCAAASGRVVYAGSGLRGYGQLIILKHSEDYLSAYAHNSKLLVKEDDMVKAGQVIADIGSSGTDREQLHFEIRFQGVPVDPLKHLPKR